MAQDNLFSFMPRQGDQGYNLNPNFAQGTSSFQLPDYSAPGMNFGGNGFDPTQLQGPQNMNPIIPQGMEGGTGGDQSFMGGLFDNFLSKKNADGSTDQGWGGPAIQGLGIAANSWMAFKNLGLMKDQLAEQKKQNQFSMDFANKNFDTQAKMANTQMSDRQRARRSASSSQYESVDSYMNKNRVG